MIMYITMQTYKALLPLLSDPTRFAIISALKGGEASVGHITQCVGIAQPGVSRHLSILHQAGVVSVRAEGQRRLYALRPEPFRDLEDWLSGFHALWSARLDRLAGALTERQFKEDDRDQ
jgi:DNA-binding transcriptional ArsR family regulator